MERYLQLCADLNMQIVNSTTPANMFHVLRRQLHRDFRKPLVVFTPKKLLRYNKAVSTVDELATGKFQEVIDDTSVKAKDVDTVVFVSGKFYYDIIEEKEKLGVGENIAVVRVEQLYPVPHKQMDAIVDKYGKNSKYIWAQEEPGNMGAWSHMLRHYRTVHLEVASRLDSASPASGSPKVHGIRQQAILDELMSNIKEKV
jgi:2-oxoglutarate dehydrogenase E1 component